MSGLKSVVAQAIVDPGTTQKIEHEFGADATITRASVHTYLGQEFDLLTDIYVITQDGVRKNVIDTVESVSASRPFAIAGNDTDYEFGVEVEVQQGDVLHIDVENLSGTHSYHADATVDYDEEWGRARALLRAVNKVIT